MRTQSTAEFNLQFGQVLRFFRKKKGLTRASLAQKVGITPYTMGRYETGTMRPNPVIIDKIANALGLDPRDLISEKSMLKMETVSERICRLRHLRKMTQEELASVAGIRKASVSIYEKGQHSMKSSTLAKIAEALGVSYEYLVLGKPQDSDFAQSELPISKLIPVVLAAVKECGDNDSRLVFKTIMVQMPNDGLEWHVMGEELRDNK